MAGHDDADRVPAGGEARGAYRLGLADAPRQFGIADGAAAADLAQGTPYAPLERGAGGLDRQLDETTDAALEVGAQGARKPAGVARGLERVAALAVIAI